MHSQHQAGYEDHAAFQGADTDTVRVKIDPTIEMKDSADFDLSGVGEYRWQ